MRYDSSKVAVLFFCVMSTAASVSAVLVAMLNQLIYIPLINRVRGPYRKLWTEVFSSPYGSSA